MVEAGCGSNPSKTPRFRPRQHSLAADPKDRPPPDEPAPAERPARAAPTARLRLLLGCTGWPSGILELASWAKHERLAEPVVFQLHAGDETDDEIDEQFVRKLIDFNPHVVGLRLESGQLQQIKRLIRTVRRSCRAEIILGGPTATSHPREVLEDTGADYVFAGEAEKSLAQFLRLAWQHNSKDLQPEIPGLAYRHGGRSYLNTLPGDGYGRTVMDVDGLICCNTLRCLRSKVRPVTEAELICGNRLDWSLLENFTGRFDALYFTAGRGCPGSCTFCAKLHGNELRTKSAGQLLEEIEAADAKVDQGAIRLSRWDLLKHVDHPDLKEKTGRLGGNLRRGLLPGAPTGDRVLPALGRQPAESALPPQHPDQSVFDARRRRPGGA